MYFHITGTNVRLLGSVHVFPQARPDLPTWVSDAYEWSESLVFESDPPTLLPFFKAQDGVALSQKVPANIYAELEKFWPPEGPLSPLNELQPWAAMLVASMFHMQMAEGVDTRFFRSATEQSKAIHFLETAQDVALAFGSIPLVEIHAGLKELVSDLSEPQRVFTNMHNAWLTRDVEALWLVASKLPIMKSQGARNAVFDFRNQAWAPVIQQMLGTTKRTLVVVGALHLCGPGNLIDRLGHNVEQV
ncbi:TraB/GumN family protein [Collimonas pratensis]|uniref:TraB/GumN family protein n=1 Tax=Collimonas pratensis TaxID=279113 RepID=UPI000784943A|nr:TraB/GumN family protein [Collimonas pratensis]